MKQKLISILLVLAMCLNLFSLTVLAEEAVNENAVVVDEEVITEENQTEDSVTEDNLSEDSVLNENLSEDTGNESDIPAEEENTEENPTEIDETEENIPEESVQEDSVPENSVPEEEVSEDELPDNNTAKDDLVEEKTEVNTENEEINTEVNTETNTETNTGENTTDESLVENDESQLLENVPENVIIRVTGELPYTINGSNTEVALLPGTETTVILEGYSEDLYTWEFAEGSAVPTFTQTNNKIIFSAPDSGYVEIVVKTVETYGVEVTGKKVTSANAADVLGDGTVTYDPSTKTLTLTNTDIAADNMSYGILSDVDLILVLNGTNKVSCTGYYGICSRASLTICGNGSLNSWGSDFGIFASGAFTVEDSVNLTASCGDVISGNSYGIRADGALTIKDQAVVTASAGYAPSRSCGIYAYTTLVIRDNAVVNTTGGGSDSMQSCGIRTTNMTVNGGSLTTTGGSAKNASYGIFTSTLDINAGNLISTGGNVSAGPSRGIQANVSLNITGGTVNGTGGQAGNDQSCGIQANSNMLISGGTVKAKTANGGYTHGIQGFHVTISGGDISAHASDAGSYSYGIQARGNMTVTGGRISTSSGNSGNFSYGIQVSGPFDISGGSVYITGGSAAECSGIWSFGDISIKDALLDITAAGTGISAPFGKLSVSCTEVTPAMGGAYGMNGTKVFLRAGNGYGVLVSGDVVISDNLTVKKPLNGFVAQTADGNKTIVSVENVPSGDVEISPLTYVVHISGLDYSMGADVPVGKSVNETYCTILGIQDFSEALNLSKEGYIFGGWFTDENCTPGNEYNFDIPVSAEITIYPKWIPVEVTQTPAPSVTPAPQVTVTPSPEATPAPQVTVTPTPELTVAPQATATPTPEPTISAAPTAAPGTGSSGTTTSDQDTNSADTSRTDAPATGDNTNIMSSVIIMLISVVVVSGIAAAKVKNK